MRTRDDFDTLYATPDPWRLNRTSQRTRALRRILAPHTRGRKVLELGCGEGHLTNRVLNTAHHVTAVDISGIALSRAPRASQRVLRWKPISWTLASSTMTSSPLSNVCTT